LGRSKVDIEWHLAKHRVSIRKLAWRYANNRHDAADVEQAIILKMIERHAKYDHGHESGASLLTYVKYSLKRDVIFKTLNQYQHITDNTVVIPACDVDEEGIDSLEDLENMGRVAPINWHLRGYGEQESSLTPEEQELAEKLEANLTDEELIILNAVVGRSERQAAEYLGYPWTTFYRKLKRARARASELAHG
jgi:RNA polymerase sigma factor (sigma-70 family)